MDESFLRPIEGSFDNSLFQTRYQRNNKRGGLKNLRCFPTCGPQHKERGFCGRSVLLKVKTKVPDKLLCWGEFLKSDEPKSLNIGHSMSLTECERQTRSKEEPLKPWVKGVFSHLDSDISIFEFNRERRGWHYGWASNKHTCNASHAFVAYVFEPSLSDPQMLIVKGVVESPSFMLFCRRRRRFTLVPSAPVSDPSKKTTADNSDEDDDSDDDDGDVDNNVKTKRGGGQKVPTTKKRETKSSKRVKFESNYSDLTLSAGASPTKKSSALVENHSATLDKNRVDAMLSVLHMAWQKLKVSESQASPVQKSSSSSSSSAVALASQSDSEFFQMLDILAGELDWDTGFLEPTLDGTALHPTLEKEYDESNDHVVDPDTEALAKYLMDESDFRQSVLWLRGQGAQPDFNAFIGILRDHIQKYMRLRLWTVSDIDRVIASFDGQNDVNKEDDNLLSNFSLDTSGVDGLAGEFIFDGYCIPNITGVWKQTRESQLAMEQVREKSGSSWVMSKLFEFMESKFTIQQQGLELSCRLWPMPSLKFVLDGDEHPWGIRLPLFQPNWTYRAWTEGRVITLQHQIENRRLTRKYWCDTERRFLYSEATLDVFDGYLNEFIQESRVTQTAERVL